jgi:hypothetical protein
VSAAEIVGTGKITAAVAIEGCARIADIQVRSSKATSSKVKVSGRGEMRDGNGEGRDGEGAGRQKS